MTNDITSPPELASLPLVRNVMVDIETTATTRNAGIWQIGAYCIETEEEFICTINPLSLVTPIRGHSFDWELETIRWQYDNNRKNWLAALSLDVTDNSAFAEHLLAFKTFLRNCHSGWQTKLVLWCKGTDFDFPILSNSLVLECLGIPWRYYQLRDLRSVAAVMGQEMSRENISHNALEDAIAQGKWLKMLLGQLGKPRK